MFLHSVEEPQLVVVNRKMKQLLVPYAFRQMLCAICDFSRLLQRGMAGMPLKTFRRRLKKRQRIVEDPHTVFPCRHKASVSEYTHREYAPAWG